MLSLFSDDFFLLSDVRPVYDSDETQAKEDCEFTSSDQREDAHSIDESSEASPWQILANNIADELAGFASLFGESLRTVTEDSPLLSPRQHLDSNGAIQDEYDPCKPEYVIAASQEEQVGIQAAQRNRQITKLEGLVHRLEHTTPQCTNILHYRKVLETLHLEQRLCVPDERLSTLDLNVVQHLDSCSSPQSVLYDGDFCLESKSKSFTSTRASSMSAVSSNPSFCVSEQNQVGAEFEKIYGTLGEDSYDEELQEQVFLSAFAM